MIGLFKTKVIRRQGPWRTLERVEFATLRWDDWFNTRRLLKPIGCVRPADSKRGTMSRQQWPGSKYSPSGIPGTIQRVQVHPRDRARVDNRRLARRRVAALRHATPKSPTPRRASEAGSGAVLICCVSTNVRNP